MSREWNADSYHRVSTPQVSWGKKVLSRLHLRGDETVLDAGCGTGRLTEDLLNALPDGEVVAVDLSRNMLSTARQHLGERFRNVTLVAADLEKLPFFDCFDVIFSTAAFHWIRNQSQLYRSLRDALCSGGWLIAQCGGGPNLAHFRERVREVMAEQPYRQHLGHFQEPWAFESAESAAELLREAGFSQIETSIESAPTTLANADVFAEFVSNVILRPHLEALPNQQLKNDLVRDLTDLASHDDPPFSLDYWRLNLQGRA